MTFFFVKLISIKEMLSIQNFLVNGQSFLIKKKKEKKKTSLIFFALGPQNDWAGPVEGMRENSGKTLCLSKKK